jgi:hypothetical protein
MSNAASRTSLVAFATAITFAGDASAQGWEPNVVENEPNDLPPSHEEAQQSPSGPIALHLELGVDSAYATPPIHGGTNPFGIGFGGHAGLSIDDFYVGARVVDFLGGTDVDVSYRSLLAGIEVGYDFRVHLPQQWFFAVRPQLGVGDAVVYYTDPALAKVDVVSSASGSSSTTTSDTLTVNSLYLDPGVTATLSSGVVYLSINGSILLLPGIVYGGAEATTWISYGSRVSVGLRF